jgi:hypothetical protein
MKAVYTNGFFELADYIIIILSLGSNLVYHKLLKYTKYFLNFISEIYSVPCINLVQPSGFRKTEPVYFKAEIRQNK